MQFLNNEFIHYLEKWEKSVMNRPEFKDDKKVYDVKSRDFNWVKTTGTLHS